MNYKMLVGLSTRLQKEIENNNYVLVDVDCVIFIILSCIALSIRFN